MIDSRLHVTDIFFTFGLFLLFVVLTLMLVIMGYTTYRDIDGDMTENYGLRTSLLYLSEKARQAYGLELATVDGGDALVFSEEYAGIAYETWIFVSGGELREVTVLPDTAVKPGDGQVIMDLAALSLALEGRILTIEAAESGGKVYREKLYLGAAL